MSSLFLQLPYDIQRIILYFLDKENLNKISSPVLDENDVFWKEKIFPGVRLTNKDIFEMFSGLHKHYRRELCLKYKQFTKYMKFEYWSGELIQKFLSDEEFVKNHIDVKDMMGRPMIMFLTLNNNNFELIKKVLEHGANVNSTEANNNTVLMFNHFVSDEILELFLSYNADPNLKNKQGITPLMFNVYHTSKVKMLLKHGADVNLRDIGNKTALMYAIERKCIESAELLVDAGADLFAIDDGERSVLDYMNFFIDRMSEERKINLDKACKLRNKIIHLQNLRNGESMAEMS